jgi:hypothetical protein
MKMASNDKNLCFSDINEAIWKAPLTLRHGGVTRCEPGWSLQHSW